ncbi:hypothetical protein Tco_0894922 [Tanacetum coccineum]|uniref:Uncharacterized protein n=1 Tax=Tanacetum coccineum TaxID=301880 RepID=A0ABQ5CD39_9ASTR
MEIKDKRDLDQNGTLVDATKYRSMIGALMYLTSSRPDIVHATCLCARYQAQPTKKHLKEVKMIFRYLWGTINKGLWYTKDSDFELTGFLNTDYAGCRDSFKSTSGGTQFLGEKLVGWSSKKQDFTTLSTTEAKYVSLSAFYSQVLWMRTTSRWRFHHIPAESQSRPHTHSQSLRIHSTIVSLQVMSKDEYVGKKCSSQEVSKIISRIKIKISSLKLEDIKTKIKIQDHKHAEGSSKEFPRTQGSKTQDVTKNEAISVMTTP